MKKILFSTLTLMSALSFASATTSTMIAPNKSAIILTDSTLIARLAAMKKIVEANESDLDLKVAQFEAFADSYDKLKRSSSFISPSERNDINAKIDETLKDIDATIVSAQEWSILPDGPQVAKLKDIKRRLHSKAKDYTGSWELGRTMSVYAHSYWKPALTALATAASAYAYNKKYNPAK